MDHSEAMLPASDRDDSAYVIRMERRLTVSHALLWTVIIVASVLDVVTTVVGLAHHLEEGNVVARAFLGTYGMPGIGLLKFCALVLLVVSWAVLVDRDATRVLIAFAVISLVTVAWNVLTLASL